MDEKVSGMDPAPWLALLRASAETYIPFGRLPESLQDPAALFRARRNELEAAGLSLAAIRRVRRPDWAGVESDLRWLSGEGNHLLTLADPGYPSLLRQIPDPPPALFVRGIPGLLGALQLAMVGSRKPTADGRRLARRFAGELVQCGLAVTSGLAYGIDSESHQGALDGEGTTVAVVGNGLDVAYPRGNRELAARIAERGALVSEFPAGSPPLAAHFPRRNRIISGLSLGTLVVEAAPRSGSLITARHALEQGREVFAVPGSVRNAMARGCHALIRQGAKLVECIEDILEEIPQLQSRAPREAASGTCDESQGKGLDGDAKLLLDNIGYEPVNIDHLIEAANVPAWRAISILSNLEIAGLIDSLPGGNYVRR